WTFGVVRVCSAVLFGFLFGCLFGPFAQCFGACTAQCLYLYGADSKSKGRPISEGSNFLHLISSHARTSTVPPKVLQINAGPRRSGIASDASLLSFRRLTLLGSA